MSNNVPVIGQIRSFKDAQRAFENIRGYFKTLVANPSSQSTTNPVSQATTPSVAASSGVSVYAGSGSPTALRNNLDLYYDITNDVFYRQVASVWIRVSRHRHRYQRWFGI